MEITEKLHCLYSATLHDHDDTYVIEVPKSEVQLGTLQPGETYRFAILASNSDERTAQSGPSSPSSQEYPAPPVEEGEQRTVEIESIGDQGDGISLVERGFVVIVPDTEENERFTVEITDVQETVAFADVVERNPYYE